MNTKILLMSYISIAISISSWAGQAPACRIDLKDKYDIGYSLDHGKYKTQCLDMARKRPAIILSEDSQTITIANFYHEKKFWLAQIPKTGVDQAIFQIVRFSTGIPFVIASHTQIRFKMKPGAELRLTTQNGSGEQTTISDFIFSVEYTAPLGVPYNVIEAQFNNVGMVARILSTKARMLEELDGSGNTVQQLPMRLDSRAADQIMVSGIHRSYQLGTLQMYNTFSRNCANEAFNLLDKNLLYFHKISPFKISIFELNDPSGQPSIDALWDRGLINQGSFQYPTMNVELPLNKNLSAGVDLSIHH